MISLETGDPAGERAIVPATILRTIPGNHRFVDCCYPPAHIYELGLTGYRLTIKRAMPPKGDAIHRVGVYILERPATYPLFFDGLDDAQVAA
jgi:hypothetical protein